MSTTTKIDRRKLRPSKDEVKPTHKSGVDAHARGRAIRSILDDLEAEILLLINSNYSLKMIHKKLIEAGAPKMAYLTLRKYVMNNFPVLYKEKIGYKTNTPPTTFHCPLASGAAIPEHLIQQTVEATPIKMPEPTLAPPPATKESPAPAPVQKPAQPIPPPAPLKEVSSTDKIERWGKFIGTYNRTTFEQFFPDPVKAKAQRVKMETALCNIFGGGTLHNMREFTRDISLTQTAADIINLNSGDDYNQLINKLVDAGISAPDELFSIRKKLPLIESVYKLNNSIIKAKSEGMPLGYIAQVKETLNKINFDYLAEKPEHIPFLQAFGILLKKAVDSQLTAS